jgi:hypothetical protein
LFRALVSGRQAERPAVETFGSLKILCSKGDYFDANKVEGWS